MEREPKVEQKTSINRLIDQVIAISGYEPKVVDGKELFVSPDGGKLYPDRIKSKEDPRLSSLYDLMVKSYGEEEATGLDWLEGSLDPGRPDRYFHAVDQNGKRAAAVHAEFLSAADKALVYLCYTFPDDNSPETLALLGRVYAEAAKENPGKEMLVSIEADGDMEEQCNAASLKRLYLRDDKGQMSEVPYKAPDMEFDSETGDGVAGQLPNHLMVWNGEKQISVEDVLAVVAAMYEQFVKYDEFDDEQARTKAEKSIQNLLDDLKVEIAGKELLLLSAQERESLIQGGQKVTEWATER